MESNIQSPYLDEEVDLRKITPFHVELALLKVTAWKRIAHHPTCSRYKNHYFTLGTWHFCVGCTMMYSGIGLTLGSFFLFDEFFQNHLVLIPIAYFLGIGVSLIHPLIKPESKWLKSVFRFFLGIGLGAYICAIIILPFLSAKLLLIGIVLVTTALYSSLRISDSSDYCSECPLASADLAFPCDPVNNTQVKMEKIKSLIQERLRYFKRLKELEKRASNAKE